MRHSITHTYAILNVPESVYRIIRGRLEEAGYSDQFHARHDGEVIDMHGIALTIEPDDCPECGATMAKCACGAQWCLDHQVNPLVCPKCAAQPSASTVAVPVETLERVLNRITTAKTICEGEQFTAVWQCMQDAEQIVSHILQEGGDGS